MIHWSLTVGLKFIVVVGLQERVPVLQLTRHVANVMQEFTQQGGVRPFGISVLIAGYDDDGPQLFQVREKRRCL
jgi:20S proteasome alpha/beta subunit